MSTDLTGHERPVDRVAARILRAAPWWAKYPEPAQAAILTVTGRHPYTAWIDYTKPPARKLGGPHCQIEDKRGRKLIWDDGSLVVIIGYAHTVYRDHPTTKPRPKPPWFVGNNWNPRQHKRIPVPTHYWWAVRNNEIFCLAWKLPSARKWREVGFIPPNQETLSALTANASKP